MHDKSNWAYIQKYYDMKTKTWCIQHEILYLKFEDTYVFVMQNANGSFNI